MRCRPSPSAPCKPCNFSDASSAGEYTMDPPKPKLSAAPRDALSALPKEMMAHVASFAGWHGLLQGLEVTGKCGRELAAPGYAHGIEKLRGRVGAVDARRACLAVAATRWNHALQPVFGDGALHRRSRLRPISGMNRPRGTRDFEARLGFAANSARTRPDDAAGTVLVCDVLRRVWWDGGDAYVTDRPATLVGSWVVDGDRCTLAREHLTQEWGGFPSLPAAVRVHCLIWVGECCAGFHSRIMGGRR